MLTEGTLLSERELAGAFGPEAQASPRARPAGRRLRARGAEPPAPLDAIEREHILDVLRQVNGNRMAAAKVLGISRRALYRRLDRHHLGDGSAAAGRAAGIVMSDPGLTPPAAARSAAAAAIARVARPALPRALRRRAARHLRHAARRRAARVQRGLRADARLRVGRRRDRQQHERALRRCDERGTRSSASVREQGRLEHHRARLRRRDGGADRR